MRTIQLLRINSIIESTKFGASSPTIVKAADNKTYILKTRFEDMEHDDVDHMDLGIFNEVLAYQIHDYLGYKISQQEVCYLIIDQDFINSAKQAYNVGVIKKESYEYIEQSLGVNIGIEYIEDAMEPLGITLTNSFKKQVMQMDNYIMNCDRVEGDNPNILHHKKSNKFYAIDYGNALADRILYEQIVKGNFNELIANQFGTCNALLSSGRYMFRNEKKLLSYKDHKKELGIIKDFLNTIINKMPPQWKPVEYQNDIVDVLSKRILEKRIFNSKNLKKCSCSY